MGEFEFEFEFEFFWNTKEHGGSRSDTKFFFNAVAVVGEGHEEPLAA